MSIPKIKTRDEQLTEDYAENPERTLWMAVIASLGASTGMNRLPEFADQNEVERKARSDFISADYSDALTYIDSLVKIADHWQQWAETYHSILVSAGATFDQYGHPSLDPFAITRDGEQVAGSAESLDIDKPDHWTGIVAYLREFIPAINHEPSRLKAAEILLEVEAKIAEPVLGTPGFGPSPAESITIRKEQ